jgi:hypothetical protein
VGRRVGAPLATARCTASSVTGERRHPPLAVSPSCCHRVAVWLQSYTVVVLHVARPGCWGVVAYLHHPREPSSPFVTDLLPSRFVFFTAGLSPHIRAAKNAAARAKTAPPPIPLAVARARAYPATLTSRPAFAGFPLVDVEEQIRVACERIIPPALATTERLRDLVLYALHRFTSTTLTALARLAGVTRAAARRTLERIRGDRLIDPDGHRMLWSLEWALRWQLRAAPYRP